MSSNKVAKFLHDNVILLVGIPMIVGVHWGWWRLQKNPALVDTSKEKEFPTIAAAKRYYYWFLDIDPPEKQSAQGQK